MRPEHDFSVNRDEWEDAVFKNAEYFTVFRRISRMNRVNTRFETLPEAIAEAKKTDGRPGLVYAVTASGRSVMLPPDKWEYCLAAWEAKK